MSDAVRTPAEALEGLPDFPFAPHYRDVDGLRLAHRDEGEGAPVIFMHGEPTWSFLWRKVIPPVRDAGFRCVAPDLAGFGASDKPVDVAWYSYERHVSLTRTLLEDLDVRSATAQGLQRQRIPGALHLPVQDVAGNLGALPHDRDIILYCTCPNEASAAKAAKLLMTRGYRRVRPLYGGLDAWIAAGYAVEEVPIPESDAATALPARPPPASRLS